MLHEADTGRADRLFPASEQIFSTNSMSLSYGACGNALFLYELDGGIPTSIREWLLSQPLSNDSYPPGLSVGLSGIAYTMLRLGEIARAQKIFAHAMKSPLLYRDASMLLGAAGWGSVALELYATTADDKYIELAESAASHLLKSAIDDGQGGLHWISGADGRTHYGFGHGGSGIAHFLMNYSRWCGADEYAVAARRAISAELRGKVVLTHGANWPRYRGDTVTFPYFIHGSTGIGTVILRHASHPRWLDLAAELDEIARDGFAVWSVLPTLYEGLAGIGEFMLDLASHRQDAVALQRSYRIARSVLLYSVKRQHGVAYPGRWNERLSTDVANGSAGVGLFLLRVIRHRSGGATPRFLVDIGTSVARGANEPFSPSVV